MADVQTTIEKAKTNVEKYLKNGNYDEAVNSAMDVLDNESLRDWTPEQILNLNDQIKAKRVIPGESQGGKRTPFEILAEWIEGQSNEYNQCLAFVIHKLNSLPEGRKLIGRLAEQWQSNLVSGDSLEELSSCGFEEAGLMVGLAIGLTGK